MTPTVAARTEAGVEPEVLSLWQGYRETHDPAVRERLILHYSPLV